MTIARQSDRTLRDFPPPVARVVDVTGLKLHAAPDTSGRPHYNFRPRGKDNVRGGLYYRGGAA